MPKKTILVACYAGIATGVVVAQKLQDALNSRGLDIFVNQINAGEINTTVKLDRPVAIVTTGKPEKIGDIPVFSGIPFITGIGETELLEEIIKLIETKKE